MHSFISVRYKSLIFNTWIMPNMWLSVLPVGVWILYLGLFSPRVIFGLLHLEAVSPRIEFVQKQLFLKRNNFRNRNSQSLKFTFWQRGRKGRTLFPVYSMKYILLLKHKLSCLLWNDQERFLSSILCMISLMQCLKKKNKIKACITVIKINYSLIYCLRCLSVTLFIKKYFILCFVLLIIKK